MTFMSLAMAAPEGQQGGGLALFLPMILIFVIFYFLMLRPQAKRAKEHEKMISQLTKGDEIVTTGGIHGVVQRVNEKEMTLIIKIADDVKVEIDRAAVGRKISGSSSGD